MFTCLPFLLHFLIKTFFGKVLCLMLNSQNFLTSGGTVGQNEGSGGNRILHGSRDSDLVLKLFPRYDSGILATYE